jgi:hypothetical protein
MSTIDEQLSEILKDTVNRAYEIMDSKSFADPYSKPKAAILSLFREIIEEAKPEMPTKEFIKASLFYTGIKEGTDRFEKRLIQAITEA